jgi:hypothetical protein
MPDFITSVGYQVVATQVTATFMIDTLTFASLRYRDILYGAICTSLH